jgi:surface protein
MAYMFMSASSFNQNIGGWDVGNVSNMFSMFRSAAQINTKLSGWCVSRIGTKPLNFDRGATAWSLPKPVWGTCPAP